MTDGITWIGRGSPANPHLIKALLMMMDSYREASAGTGTGGGMDALIFSIISSGMTKTAV